MKNFSERQQRFLINLILNPHERQLKGLFTALLIRLTVFDCVPEA